MSGCIGHGNGDPCHCFERVSSTRPTAGITPQPFVQHGMHLDSFLTDPLVAGEVIPAGTEVIIKDGKLYARPATPLELMIKQRDEALVALKERNERVETLAERLALAEKARDSYSRQLSDLIRQNRALQERINNA